VKASIVRFALLALMLAAVAAVAAPPLAAQGRQGTPPAGGYQQGGMPAPLRTVGFDQRLGAVVPADLAFLDSAGRQVAFGDYLGERPVVLVLAYYDCPMLCDLVLQGVARALKPLAFDPGRQFDVVVASIDPRETPALAAAQREDVLSRYGRPGTEAGWHFLTGPQESIDRLAETVGFRYEYDENRGEFAHAAGIVVLTPKGKVSRYLFGIDFPSRDVRLALVESTEDRIGSVVDQVMLYCFHYDPQVGRYSALTMRIVRVAGALTLAGLVGMIVILRRRESAAVRAS
jgi:protein SCO1